VSSNLARGAIHLGEHGLHIKNMVICSYKGVGHCFKKKQIDTTHIAVNVILNKIVCVIGSPSYHYNTNIAHLFWFVKGFCGYVI